VEKALGQVPGVTAASVNFANQTAAVAGKATIETLVDAVHRAGYEAHPFQDESVEEQEAEVRKSLHRSLYKSSAALAGGAVLMGDMAFGYLPALSSQVVWIGAGLITLVLMVISGGHFFRGAVTALMNRTATMDTLIALGTGTAWIFSMIVVLLPGFLPEASRHQFFEAALFIIGFVNLGKALEANARSKASLAIQKLFDLTPKFVSRLRDGEEELVPLERVMHDDVLRIRPGGSMPVDGEVIAGVGSIDESMLTGESEAVPKAPGSIVRAGTVNLDGALLVRADGVGKETVLAGMVRLVTEAQNSKPELAQIVDKISAVFVPVVIVIALLTSLLWFYFGPAPAVSHALVTGMSVLIIACPCALGLAIPMSVMVGLGRAAVGGLLVRNSEILQTASQLTMVVLDKTGTLTLGQPRVVDVVGLTDADLGIAMGLETHAEHPLARAIVDYCASKEVTAATMTAFTSQAGGGVSGSAGTRQVALGSEAFLRSQGAGDFPGAVTDSGSAVSLMIDGEVRGSFMLRDTVREDAASAVAEMNQAGIRVVMLSGDRESAAREVAGETGISEVQAGLLPEDKLDRIREWQRQGEVVGMAGDGINDAAALAAADVGFAMGEGTDIAMESADVTLLGESLHGIAHGIHLSRRITSNIRQNLFAAFAYNVLLIPVAAGALYPFYGVLMNPALAGLAMALSSVSVVFNAGRLRNA